MREYFSKWYFSFQDEYSFYFGWSFQGIAYLGLCLFLTTLRNVSGRQNVTLLAKIALLCASNINITDLNSSKQIVKKFDDLTYLQVLSKDLKVMDAAAITLARDSKIPIVVFSIHKANAFVDVITGKGSKTIISDL